MHHIHTTRGFVIHSHQYGESNKHLQVFTYDFGLIYASAQGVRLSKSKLKYNLQDGDFSRISLVRGKEIWRITGAEEIVSFRNLDIQIKIFSILRRLLHGEEINHEIFKILENIYTTKFDDNQAASVEMISVLRILMSLGYIKNNNLTDKYFISSHIDNEIIDFATNEKKELIKVINNALHESQL